MYGPGEVASRRAKRGPMTRIIAGTHGGRRLAAPAGAGTRPTSDRVREAFFSSLETMTDLSEARFADLSAGPGDVGLALRVGPAVRLVTGKVLTTLAGPPDGGPYDVVFADPPYALGAEEIDT